MKLPWRPMPLLHLQISTSLTEQEAEYLCRLAQGAKVLEVGSAFGYSTIRMAQVAREVTSVDVHWLLDSYGQFIDNIKSCMVADKVVPITGNSKEVLPRFPDSSFDMAFIDGDHHYDGVKFDVQQALRLVKKGGCIAIHDYGEETCPDVARVIDELFDVGLVTDTLFVVRR